MDSDGRLPLFFDQATFLLGLDEPDQAVVCEYQRQKHDSRVCPFRRSGFPGHVGLDNVMERFGVTSTGLTLVDLFNLFP
jgi:hypothetical protein